MEKECISNSPSDKLKYALEIDEHGFTLWNRATETIILDASDFKETFIITIKGQEDSNVKILWGKKECVWTC